MRHAHGVRMASHAALSHVQLECRKWIPDAATVTYKGSPDARKLIWENEMGEGATPCRFNVLLTTYELIMKDKQRLKKFQYRYIIIDEGHRMKNAASKLSATLLQYESQHRVLLTGTPPHTPTTRRAMRTPCAFHGCAVGAYRGGVPWACRARAVRVPCAAHAHTVCVQARRCRTRSPSCGRCSTSCCRRSSRPQTLSNSGSPRRSPT